MIDEIRVRELIERAIALPTLFLGALQKVEHARFQVPHQTSPSRVGSLRDFLAERLSGRNPGSALWQAVCNCLSRDNTSVKINRARAMVGAQGDGVGAHGSGRIRLQITRLSH